ncbi:hypothetical protein MICA_63 [Micavibrio aeruginosavorus ARL-13]|uniref:Uncharacterized protein n=1 Tax=Micavibrio aeruginosavorus (strain ARL-13) TaxID=856793 RepID=G2KLH5_MICAA|nr:hypothetical protein MICA_63 [Micavibrio aeruginosavorus ARL-13]
MGGMAKKIQGFLWGFGFKKGGFCEMVFVYFRLFSRFWGQ